MRRLFTWTTMLAVLLVATPAMAAIDEMVMTIKGMSCAF